MYVHAYNWMHPLKWQLIWIIEEYWLTWKDVQDISLTGKSIFQNSVYSYFIPIKITVIKDKTKQKIASIGEGVGKS